MVFERHGHPHGHPSGSNNSHSNNPRQGVHDRRVDTSRPNHLSNGSGGHPAHHPFHPAPGHHSPMNHKHRSSPHPTHSAIQQPHHPAAYANGFNDPRHPNNPYSYQGQQQQQHFRPQLHHQQQQQQLFQQQYRSHPGQQQQEQYHRHHPQQHQQQFRGNHGHSQGRPGSGNPGGPGHRSQENPIHQHHQAYPHQASGRPSSTNPISHPRPQASDSDHLSARSSQHQGETSDHSPSKRIRLLDGDYSTPPSNRTAQYQQQQQPQRQQQHQQSMPHSQDHRSQSQTSSSSSMYNNHSRRSFGSSSTAPSSSKEYDPRAQGSLSSGGRAHQPDSHSNQAHTHSQLHHSPERLEGRQHPNGKGASNNVTSTTSAGSTSGQDHAHTIIPGQAQEASSTPAIIPIVHSGTLETTSQDQLHMGLGISGDRQWEQITSMSQTQSHTSGAGDADTETNSLADLLSTPTSSTLPFDSEPYPTTHSLTAIPSPPAGATAATLTMLDADGNSADAVTTGNSLSSALQHGHGGAASSNAMDSASLVAVLMSAMTNEADDTDDPLAAMFSSSSASLSAIPEVPVTVPPPVIPPPVALNTTATPTAVPSQPPAPAAAAALSRTPAVIVESHEEDELLEPLPVLTDTPEGLSSSQDDLLLEATKALTQALQPSESLLPLTPMNHYDDSEPDHPHHPPPTDHLHPSAADHPSQSLHHHHHQHLVDLDQQEQDLVEQLELEREREREQEQIKAREMLGLMLPDESEVIVPSSSVNVSAIPFYPQPELPVEEEVYDPLLDMQMHMEMEMDQMLPESDGLPQPPSVEDAVHDKEECVSLGGPTSLEVVEETIVAQQLKRHPFSPSEKAIPQTETLIGKEGFQYGSTVSQLGLSDPMVQQLEQVHTPTSSVPEGTSTDKPHAESSVGEKEAATASSVDEREPTPEPPPPTIPDTFPTIDKLYQPTLSTMRGGTTEVSASRGHASPFTSSAAIKREPNSTSDWQSAKGADLALLSEMRMAAMSGTDLARFRRESKWLEERAQRWEEHQRLDQVSRKLMDKALGLTVTRDYSHPTTHFDQHQLRQQQRENERRLERRHGGGGGGEGSSRWSGGDRPSLAPPPGASSSRRQAQPAQLPVAQQEFRISSETRLALSVFKVNLVADLEEQARLLADHEALNRSLDKTRGLIAHLAKKEDAVQKRIIALVEQEPEREKELLKLDKLERACEAMIEQQAQQTAHEVEVLEAKLRLLEEQRRVQSEAESKGQLHHQQQDQEKDEEEKGLQNRMMMPVDTTSSSAGSPSSSNTTQSSSDNDDDDMGSSLDGTEEEETRDAPLALVMSSRTPILTSASTLASNVGSSIEDDGDGASVSSPLSSSSSPASGSSGSPSSSSSPILSPSSASSTPSSSAPPAIPMIQETTPMHQDVDDDRDYDREDTIKAMEEQVGIALDDRPKDATIDPATPTTDQATEHEREKEGRMFQPTTQLHPQQHQHQEQQQQYQRGSEESDTTMVATMDPLLNSGCHDLKATYEPSSSSDANPHVP